MVAKLADLGLILGPQGGRTDSEADLTWMSAPSAPNPLLIFITSALLQCWVSLVWDMSICNLSAGSDCLAPLLRTEVHGEVSGFIMGWDGAKRRGDLRSH